MSRDAHRYRKTYSYVRQEPRIELIQIVVDETLDWKNSVRVASTAHVTLSGATSLVIDGITLADEDRVLLKNQTDGYENGIYYYEVTGANYVLTRASDASQGTISCGATTYVEEGTANNSGIFIMSTTGPINVGSTQIAWTHSGINGTGTPGTVPIWDSASSLNNSIITQSAGAVTITGPNALRGSYGGGGQTSSFAAGDGALYSNIAGNYNTAIGVNALYRNTGGGSNTASGVNALHNNTTGDLNTASGVNALQNNTTGYHNTASGVNALQNNTTGYHNTASGVNALRVNTTGHNNTASGLSALYSNTTGIYNTASGGNSLYSNTTGHNNTAIGADALRTSTTGYHNTASGVNALYSNTTGNSNTASGLNALYTNTTGDLNTASGVSALYSNTTGYVNTALGADALRANTTGNLNTASGVQALYINTTGNYNTASGVNALYRNTGGGSNTASGVNALYTNTTGDLNTASGVQALYSNTTGHNNTASGVSALYSNTTGTNNTAVGYNTGLGITTGSGNTILGANVASLTDTLTNNIILANGTGAIKARHDGTNWELTGNVGIGTTSPDMRLSVYTSASNGTDGLRVFGGAVLSSVRIQPAMPDHAYNNIVQAGDSGIIFHAATVDSGAFVIAPWSTGPSGLRMTSAGKVGIGTSSPTRELDVAGSINISQQLYIGNGSQGFFTWGGGAGNTFNLVGASGKAISLGSNGIYDRLFVTAGGNVGIGTAGPLANLSVASSTYNAPGLTNKGAMQIAFANSNGLSFGSYDSGSYSTYIQGISSPSGITVVYPISLNPVGGNVGVGTTAPLQKLQVGSNTIVSTATPDTISLGGTISSTAGFNLKLRLFDDGSTYGGIGVSALQQDYSIPSGNSHVFFIAGAEKVRIASSGNVGIGTNDPPAKLSVYSTDGSTFTGLSIINNPAEFAIASSDILFCRTPGHKMAMIRGSQSDSGTFATGFLSFATRANDAEPVERMRIDSSGNVGIGTTSPAHKLDVAGKIGGSVYGDSYLEFRSNGNTTLKANNTVNIGYSDTVNVTNTGLVGIGTTSPTAVLNVNSAKTTALSTHDDFNTLGVSVDDPTAFAPGVGGGIAFRGMLNPSSKLIYGAIDAARESSIISDYRGALRFWTNNNSTGIPTEGMRITSAGNVGIGTTAPLQKLQVGSNAFVSTATPDTISLGGTYSSAAGLNLKLRLFDDGSNYGGIGVSALQQDYSIPAGNSHVFFIAGAEKVRIASSGNVGIGTTSPGGLLHLSKTSDTDYLALKVENIPSTLGNISSGYIGFYSNPGNGSNNALSTGKIYGKFDTNSYASARLTFSTVTGSDVYVDTMTLKAGNVGIGTTSPQAKLDVAGTINSSTEYRFSGNSFSRLASIDGGGGFGGGYNFNWNNGAPQHDSAGSTAGFAYASDGTIRFYCNSAQLANTAAPIRLYIAPTGNVGIGVTAPSEKLHIAAGNIKVDTAGYGVRFASSPTNADTQTLDAYYEKDLIVTLESTNSNLDCELSYNTLKFTRVGRMVTISGYLQVDTVTSTGTGRLYIDLGTTVAERPSSSTAASIYINQPDAATDWNDPPAAYADSGTSRIYIDRYAAGQSLSNSRTLSQFVVVDQEFMVSVSYSTV